MKQAFYYKRFNDLCFFTSRNTTQAVACYSLKQAKAIIKASGIEQKLVIITL